jgi:predicted transglutaminase-like cysteine proteinase
VVSAYFVFERMRRVALALTVCAIAGLGTACTTTGSTTAGPMTLAGLVTPPEGALLLCQETPEACGSARADAEPATPISAQLPTGGREPGPGSQEKRLVDADRQVGLAVELTPEPAQPQTIEATSPEAQAQRLAASAETMALLYTVNQQVNRALRWRSDEELYGMAERWAMPLSGASSGTNGQAYGDCEDYALEKRAALIRAGLPAEALAIATAYSHATGHHAVLIVRLEETDLVLDNETPWILPWSETPYSWRAIQSGPSLLEWRALAMAH